MLAVYQFLSCCNLPSLIIIDRSMKVATYYILYTISKHYVESHSQCLLTIIYISSCPVIIRLEKGIFQWVHFNPCHDRDMWIWLLCVLHLGPMYVSNWCIRCPTKKHLNLWGHSYLEAYDNIHYFFASYINQNKSMLSWPLPNV